MLVMCVCVWERNCECERECVSSKQCVYMWSSSSVCDFYLCAPYICSCEWVWLRVWMWVSVCVCVSVNVRFINSLCVCVCMCVCSSGSMSVCARAYWELPVLFGFFVWGSDSPQTNKNSANAKTQKKSSTPNSKREIHVRSRSWPSIGFGMERTSFFSQLRSDSRIAPLHCIPIEKSGIPAEK